MTQKKIEQIVEPEKMQKRAIDIRKEGKSIGFVPTMGYFHEGHLSLMRAARRQMDCVVVSIFINPLQFGPSEDFAKYPRDMERDLNLAESEDIDILFTPTTQMLYPSHYLTYIEVEGLSGILCGASRPGHFRGVTTVVCKLFNLVMPDTAYFGQKDAQQAIIIKKMVKDLNMPIEINILPTVREKDGLAMSSRNVYLSEKERISALCLYRAIMLAQGMVKKGETDTSSLTNKIESFLKSDKMVEVEYVSILHPQDLSYIKKIEDEALLAIAIRIGKNRLIDNDILKIKRY